MERDYSIKLDCSTGQFEKFGIVRQFNDCDNIVDYLDIALCGDKLTILIYCDIIECYYS